MSIAIALEDNFLRVKAAMAFGQHFPRWANVSPVEEDNGVEACHCSVHGGNSSVRDQKLPRARKLSACENYQSEEYQ